MTEIQFLLDLMLNHKLAAPVKEKILARIGEVEQRISSSAQPMNPVRLAGSSAPIPPIIAHSAEAAAALASRQAAIQQSVNNISEPGRTSPRKF